MSSRVARALTGPGRREALALVIVACVTTVFVAFRLAGAPLQSFGGQGGQYRWHADRLDVQLALRSFGAGELNSNDLLQTIDFGFPPLLHVITTGPASLLGASAPQILWTGWAWVLLLAAAVAVVGSRLSLESGLQTRRVACAAAIGVLLLPAMQGFAIRYYFDLPMTALLWTAWALCLWLWERRSPWPGVLVGGTLAAAALTKWSALPFAAGPLLGLGILASRRGPNRRRRLATLGIAAAVLVLFVGSYLRPTTTVPGRGSIAQMTDTFAPFSSDHPDEAASLATSIGTAFGALAELAAPSRLAPRLRHYAVWWTKSVTSPALGLVLVLLVGVWLGRSRTGALFIVAAGLGPLLFVLLVVPPLDERFLLTAAPAFVLAAALGWSALPDRWRGGVGLAVVALGLVVGSDFHFGSRGEALAEPGLRLGDIRQWGASDSFTPDAGWTRGESTGVDGTLFRQQLWGIAEACEAMTIGIGAPDDVPVLSDISWWGYRVRLALVERGGRLSTPMILHGMTYGPESVLRLRRTGDLDPLPDRTPDIVLTYGPTSDSIAAPIGIDLGRLRLEGYVPALDRPGGGGVWRPSGSPPCDAPWVRDGADDRPLPPPPEPTVR